LHIPSIVGQKLFVVRIRKDCRFGDRHSYIKFAVHIAAKPSEAAAEWLVQTAYRKFGNVHPTTSHSPTITLAATASVVRN